MIMVDWRDAKGRFMGTERYGFRSRAIAEWFVTNSKGCKIPRESGWKADYYEVTIIDSMDEAEMFAAMEG